MNIAMLIGVVVLIACGVYLILERSITRMLLGIILIGNGVNLLVFSMSGRFGLAPIDTKGAAPEDYSDPLPQAFILTAIVITFGVTAFMLALLYRSWRLAQGDQVSDDAEDVAIREREEITPDESFDTDDAGDTEFGEHAETALSTARIDLDDGEDADAPRPSRDA